MESAARSLIGLLDQANHLKQLPRTGWLLAGLANVESVADHSFSTALLSMFLADGINRGWAEQGLSQPLEVSRVLRLALIHDLAEGVLTDLPKRSSELLGADVKHDAERAHCADGGRCAQSG
ncbi:MAG: HD domain-containing protein [Caldilineaceae bacterium]|nr:HD domain-containing protein [Caldilineaceae bacterium]